MPQTKRRKQKTITRRKPKQGRRHKPEVETRKRKTGQVLSFVRIFTQVVLALIKIWKDL